MDLVPYIYHEVQARDGSMLCAQHCLNNLLQQNLYTAVDLADMAADLDRSENATLGAAEQRTSSQNMDDTGFFSISVLEKALQVFDLRLVRWRSPEMTPFQAQPEAQEAFILNLSSHWLPLRRFAGSPERWYNLNSFLPHPEWISATYLGLVLQQAEAEGYSVFVVRADPTAEGQAEAEGQGVLPESQADLIGLEMGPPARVNIASSTYASVTRSNLPPSAQPPAPAPPAPPPAAAHPDPDADAASLLAASLERSRANLQRFQAEQAAAGAAVGSGTRRRRRQADVPDLFGGGGGSAAGGEDLAEEEEEETEFERRARREAQELERAIAASLAEAPAPAPAASETGGQPIDVDDDEDVDVDVDEQDAAEAFDFHHLAREYDDEDAELQAAIDASLREGAMPVGWTVPGGAGGEGVPVRTAAGRVDAQAEADEAKEQVDEDDVSEPEVELSAEELRRKRLERFK